jgi:ribosome maturation factor RimP
MMSTSSHSSSGTRALHGVDRPALERVVEPIVRAHGAELVDIEFKPERGGWVLRILVERQGASERLLSTRDAAINLELCSGISRDLSPALDVADLIAHPYHLEVGSPGVERPLYTERDFVRFEGAKAKLKLHEPVAPTASSPAALAGGAGGEGAGSRPAQAVVIGTLAGVVEGRVRVVEGAHTFEVPLANVERARLVFEFGSSGPRRSNGSGSGTQKRKH